MWPASRKQPIPAPSPAQARQWDVQWQGISGWDSIKKKRGILSLARRARKRETHKELETHQTVPKNLAWAIAQQDAVRTRGATVLSVCASRMPTKSLVWISEIAAIPPVTTPGWRGWVGA